MKNLEPVIFVIGAGRSGTTILGDVLGRHDEVTKWHEPYFIWDYYLGNLVDDIREANQLSERDLRFIRKEFEIFLGKSDAKMVVDKSPLNSFKIPFILTVFPNAKWVHIIRDGRDVTLSTYREWEKARRIVEERRFLDLFTVATKLLKRQVYWRNRLQVIEMLTESCSIHRHGARI